MAYPHIETAADYKRYETSVAAFWKQLGDPKGWHFSPVPIDPETGGCLEVDIKTGRYPCNYEVSPETYEQEPYFSWYPCECCGRNLGGAREDVCTLTALGEIWEGAVCVNCIYYIEYGQLDDQTMMEIERSGECLELDG